MIHDPVFGSQHVNVARQQQDPGSQLNLVKRMIGVRKQHPALGLGTLEWAETGANPAVLAFYRVTSEETVLAVHNFSQEQQAITIMDPPGSRFESLLTGQKVLGTNGSLKLALNPYETLWLQNA